MAKITMSEPDGQYSCELDTEVMRVQVRECFTGMIFVAASGERLAVVMRDSGFEVHYDGDFGEKGFDAGWVEFKDNKIEHRTGGPLAEAPDLKAKLDDIDRVARGYGFEIGRGHPLTMYVKKISDDNPFLDPNWKDKIIEEETEPDGSDTKS